MFTDTALNYIVNFILFHNDENWQQVHFFGLAFANLTFTSIDFQGAGEDAFDLAHHSEEVRRLYFVPNENIGFWPADPVFPQDYDHHHRHHHKYSRNDMQEFGYSHQNIEYLGH